MSTTYTTPYTGRDPSATGIQQRSVSDEVRKLFPAASRMLALVAEGKVNKGQLTKGKGLISKTSCDSRRYEWFTYTPPAVEFSVSSVAGANITLASATGLVLKRTIMNLTNYDVGRISSISSNVITVTGINDASFTVTSGDNLLVLAPAYEEGSSNPYRTMKDEDNSYNVMQIFRFPIAISASAKIQKSFGGDFWARVAENNMTNGLRLIENTLLFGERAYTTTTDLTADATLGDSFGSMRGVWNWAQKSYSCCGAMTPEKWLKDLDQMLANTISTQQNLVFLTSSRVIADMQSWAFDHWMLTKEGDYSKFGLKTKVFSTGKYDIEVMAHDAFDKTGNEGRGIIIAPDDIDYVYRTGRDLEPKKGIQDNSTDGYEDDIIGEITLAEKTGGQHCCRVTDWFLS